MSAEYGLPTTADAARMALAREVASDLGGIFAEAPAAAHGPAKARPVAIERRAGAAVGRLSLAGVGAMAAAAFVGLAAGSALVSAHPGLGPSRAAPTSPPAAVAVPHYDDSVEVASARARADARATPSAPAARPEPARPVRRGAEPVRLARADGCQRARCSRAEVMAADRRLRVAYSRAIRAGVPRPVLVSYRDRWARLRWQAADRPQRLVDGYLQLSSGLSREAARSRRS